MGRGRSLSTEYGKLINGDAHDFVDVAEYEYEYDMCADDPEGNSVLVSGVTIEEEKEPVAGSEDETTFVALSTLYEAYEALTEIDNLYFQASYLWTNLKAGKFKEDNEIARASAEIINNIIELRKNFNEPAYHQVEEKIKKLEANYATEDKNAIQYQSYKKYKKKVAVKGYCDAAKIALGATGVLALIGTAVAFAAAWPISLTICGFAAVGFALGSFFGGKRERKSYDKSILNHSYRRSSEYELKKNLSDFAQCARKAKEASKPKSSLFNCLSCLFSGHKKQKQVVSSKDDNNLLSNYRHDGVFQSTFRP